MKLRNTRADIFVPDGTEICSALARTTHLGVGAHPDDLEMLAIHGILQCFESEIKWFTGVTCSSGSGSPRTGVFEHFTDDQMVDVRRNEQRKAAEVGKYSAVFQLGYSSQEVRKTARQDLVADLASIIDEAQPEVVYTHNPADKHETHVGVCTAVIQAIRTLPQEKRPSRLLGVEMWRSLDWLCDNEKTLLDVSRNTDLSQKLVKVFESQIQGGKDYSSAAAGRRRANVTFYAPRDVDQTEELCYAMDLTPLIEDDSIDVVKFVMQHINHLADDIRLALSSCS